MLDTYIYVRTTKLLVNIVYEFVPYSLYPSNYFPYIPTDNPEITHFQQSWFGQ